MQQVGTLGRDQLIAFFRNELSEVKAEAVINSLCQKRVLTYDKVKNRLSYYAAPDRIDAVVSRDIYAFWLISEMSSTKISQVARMEYPSQFFVITNESDEYDITVITSTSEADIARRMIQRSKIKDVEDEVIHVALLYDQKLAADISPYGFDCWAVVDRQSHRPVYGNFEESQS